MNKITATTAKTTADTWIAEQGYTEDTDIIARHIRAAIRSGKTRHQVFANFPGDSMIHRAVRTWAYEAL